MILPVFAYGSRVLKQVASEIDANDSSLNELIDNMFETMYQSEGLGLAAPQIGESLRLFIIDASPMAEDDETLQDFKQVFINAQIVEEEGDFWSFNEGCLSVPGVREDIKRKSKIRMTYVDENFKSHDEYFDGIKARIIMHEYDHLEGKLFVDRVSPIRKRLLKSKLNGIMKGDVDIKYKMKFPVKK